MTVRNPFSVEHSERRLREWVDELTPYIRVQQQLATTVARRGSRSFSSGARIGLGMTLLTLAFLGVLAPVLLW